MYFWLFGVTPVGPWELQQQFASLKADAPSWRRRRSCGPIHLPVLVATLWERLMTTVRDPHHSHTVSYTHLTLPTKA